MRDHAVGACEYAPNERQDQDTRFTKEEIMRWADDLPARGTVKAVLMRLARLSDERGQCCASTAFLAREVGCSTRHVKRVLKSLVFGGVIQSTLRYGKQGYRISSAFTLSVGATFNGCELALRIEGRDYENLGAKLAPSTKCQIHAPKCQDGTKPKCQDGTALETVIPEPEESLTPESVAARETDSASAGAEYGYEFYRPVTRERLCELLVRGVGLALTNAERRVDEGVALVQTYLRQNVPLADILRSIRAAAAGKRPSEIGSWRYFTPVLEQLAVEVRERALKTAREQRSAALRAAIYRAPVPQVGVGAREVPEGLEGVYGDF